VPKTPTTNLSKSDFELLYAEVESRIERKFEARIRSLENELDRAKEDRDVWQKRYFKQVEVSERLDAQLKMSRAEVAVIGDNLNCRLATCSVSTPNIGAKLRFDRRRPIVNTNCR